MSYDMIFAKSTKSNKRATSIPASILAFGAGNATVNSISLPSSAPNLSVPARKSSNNLMYNSLSASLA